MNYTLTNSAAQVHNVYTNVNTKASRKDFAQHHNLRITPRAPGTTQPFQDIARTARDVLEYLWRLTDEGKNLTKVTQVRLAQEFCVTRMTIHRVLKHLQEKGYIFPVIRTGFMVVQWAVSLKPKFLGQTLKTLPMVKWASQSIKDFLKSVKQALIDKRKQGGGCNIYVTHTSQIVITNGSSPPLAGCEPPEKPSVTGGKLADTNKKAENAPPSFIEIWTKDFPSDEALENDVSWDVAEEYFHRIEHAYRTALENYVKHFNCSPVKWLLDNEWESNRFKLAHLRHAISERKQL